MEELRGRDIGQSQVNRLQRLEEVCRRLQREYEREEEEYGFPFNFALRDAHRDLMFLLDEPSVSRELAPGDKVREVAGWVTIGDTLGVAVENYGIEKNLETCKKNALSILKNPGDHHPETLFQAEVVLRMWSRIVELEAAESEVKRLKDNQKIAAAIGKLITALHEVNVPLGTLDSFLGSAKNGGGEA